MAGFNKGCHIVASDYGNMLLIKGDGSAEEPTLSAADALAGYINVSMFTQTDFPVNTPVRFSLVSKVVGDPITADIRFLFGISEGQRPMYHSPKLLLTVRSIRNGGRYTRLNIAGVAGDDPIPLRIRYNIPGGHLGDRAIYIATIQFTANPSGECPEFDPVNFNRRDTPNGSPATGIDAIGETNGFVAWDSQYI
ncbi:MAG: hypothetical protein V8Q80_01080 [Barnesiella intestinihominis]